MWCSFEKRSTKSLECVLYNQEKFFESPFCYRNRIVQVNDIAHSDVRFQLLECYEFHRHGIIRKCPKNGVPIAQSSIGTLKSVISYRYPCIYRSKTCFSRQKYFMGTITAKLMIYRFKTCFSCQKEFMGTITAKLMISCV